MNERELQNENETTKLITKIAASPLFTLAGVVATIISIIVAIFDLKIAGILFAVFVGIFIFYLMVSRLRLRLIAKKRDFIAQFAKNVASEVTHQIQFGNPNALNSFQLLPDKQKDLLLFNHLAGKYGIGYEKLVVEVNIESDGSATIKRTVTVKAYAQQLDQLDTYLLLPEGGNLEEINLTSLTPPYRIIKNDDQSSLIAGKKKVVFNLDPPLADKQQLTYELVERLPIGKYAIQLTETELDNRQTPDDYAGWSITRPTKDFELKAFFPRGIFGYTGKPDVVVRYASSTGGTSSRHQSFERLRLDVKELNENNHRVLLLQVPHPMVGLVYMIQWTPLAK